MSKEFSSTEIKFQSGKVFLISFAHLIHDVFSSFLAPILPLLIQKFGLSYTSAGILTFVQRIPSFINPLFGLIADKLPIKNLMIFAPGVTAVVMSLLGTAPNYFSVIVVLLITGLAASLFHIVAPVVVKTVAGSRIGKGMSFFMLGGEIARTLGPILILSVVSWWGLENTYRLLPIGIAASLILYIRFRNFEVSSEVITKPENAKAKQALKEAMPSIISIAGVIFFNSLIKSAFSAFLPTLLTSQGETLWAGGISLSIFQLAGAAGTLSAGTLSDKIGRRTTLLISTLSIPFLSTAYLFSPIAIQIFVLLLLGFMLFAATPVTLAEINDIGSKRPAFINSIYMAVNFIISALNVIVVGAVSDIIDLHTTFLVFGILSAGGYFFVIRLSNKK